jgi:hypothetical protein
MTKKAFSRIIWIYLPVIFSCHTPEMNKQGNNKDTAFKPGEFGYDLEFLEKQDSGLVVLKSVQAQVIVSPRYQAKVFTSTSAGERALSFGWINYEAFENKTDAHMNAYGGENRIWLGPEGGQFSLFFKPGSKMIFENWKTPAAFDTESWNLKTNNSKTVSLFKDMELINYKGTKFTMRVDRIIKILDLREIISRTGIPELKAVRVVGYETDNILTNKTDWEWTAATGMPCIWMLDMFKPSPATIVVVPFQLKAGEDFSGFATTNYFGEIPPDRLKHRDSLLIFRADGKNRGKLGIAARRAKNIAGSYDADNKVLTVIIFDVDSKALYLNQEWNTIKPTFSGDAVNAYNDGPLADGKQMGPFYEIESVSPAAFLKPQASLSHKHAVFHFSGDEKELDGIAKKLLGLSLENSLN